MPAIDPHYDQRNWNYWDSLLALGLAACNDRSWDICPQCGRRELRSITRLY